MRRHAIASAVLPVLLAVGCLEREEVITVSRDGTVRIVHTWKGDPGDLDEGGAARLPRGPLWQVERWRETRGDGREEAFLRASADFARVDLVPTRFGREDDPRKRHALHLSSGLERIVEPERELFVFSRRYHGRSWAESRHLDERYLDHVRELTRGKEFEDLAPEQRRTVVTRLVQHERALLQMQGEAVLRRVTAGSPAVVDRLVVREAVAVAFDGLVDVPRALDLLERDSKEIAALTERVHDVVAAAIVGTVRGQLGPAAPTEEHIRNVFESLRHDREVTVDLEDEQFIVRLTLPGEVLRHNADEVDGGTLIWKFAGKNLRDRDHELLAVAAVER